jgi:hypothetical protein
MKRCAHGFAALALGLPVHAAAGAEMCVVCAEPAATYRCTVEGADRFVQYRGSDRVIQYLCITELAKTGGHASCGVSRNAGGACMGELKTVRVRAEDALARAEEAMRGGAPQPNPSQKEPPKLPDDGPPKTLEELARKTVEQSQDQWQTAGKTVNDTAKSAGQQIGKAGEAVGGAVKKTWTCLASLFTDC